MKVLIKSLLVVALVSLITFSAFSISLAEDADLEVLDIKVAASIVDREPVDIADTFNSDIGQVYCYSKIKVNTDSSTIYHLWYLNEEKVTQIELNVKKAPGFRTYSSKTITAQHKGNWEVEVQDASGNILSSVKFTVE